MKTKNCKKLLITVALVGLTLLINSCRPSVQEVIKVISTVPLGASRDEVRKILVEAYGKKFPKLQQEYTLINGPYPVYEDMIKADTNLLAVFKKDGSFTDVYPSDIYDRMPAKAFTQRIGLVAGASDSSSELRIFYDGNTNYIGFFAYSEVKAQ